MGMKRCIIVMLSSASLLGLIGIAPAHAGVASVTSAEHSDQSTIPRHFIVGGAGAVGNIRHGGLQRNYCEVPEYRILTMAMKAYRTSRYPDAAQTIQQITKGQWYNGSRWVTRQIARSAATARPGQYVKYNKVGVSVDVAGFWRLHNTYNWYVGGSRVGTLTIAFNVDEYVNRGARVVDLGSAGGGCRFRA
jgi:hypothetical protein